jgi:putative addiction module killer protein
MTVTEYSIRYYVTNTGRRPFPAWLMSLSDRDAAARVQVRLDRLRLGNLGDAKSLGRGSSELRIDAGPGYRVYFTTEKKSIIILLCGGDRSTQAKDIRRAREYLEDYLRRSDAEN